MLAWAQARGLAGQWLGDQWDDPEIVPFDKCRYDVRLEIPCDVDAGSDVSITDFPAMKVAEIHVAGPIGVELRAFYCFRTPFSPWNTVHIRTS